MHSQIVFLFNVQILVCQRSKCDSGYGRFYDLMRFLGNIHVLLHVWKFLASQNFYKLCVFMIFVIFRHINMYLLTDNYYWNFVGKTFEN